MPPNASAIGKEWKALQTALKQGNLSAAQTAFSAIQQNMPAGPQGSQSNQSSSNNPMAQAMSNLESALSKGDLTGAQTAFSTLQSDMQKGPKPGSVPPLGALITGANTTTDTSSSTNTGTVLETSA